MWSNRMREKVLSDRAPSTVAMVGLGKIGLPLATWYAMHGWRVIGCDINPRIVEQVNAGISHVQEEPERAVEVPRLVRQCEVVGVTVPVVVDERHQVKFEAIDDASEAIGSGLKPGTLVIYETPLP